MGWAPPQKHSKLDPVGVMTALLMVAELGLGKKINRVFPHDNTIADNIPPDFTALPRIGDYLMEKVRNVQQSLDERVVCEFCAKDYKSTKALNHHKRFYHLGTEVVIWLEVNNFY